MHAWEWIGFGGGCHWCTEAVFQALDGVAEVRQGFIRSDPPEDGWSEAVEIDFDPQQVALDDLLAVHLATHASTSAHQMRGKYRSAVYTTTEAQYDEAATVLQRLRTICATEFVTRVLHHRGFKSSDSRFHGYYASDPDRPFCRTYIDPKLAKLRTQFGRLLNESR